MEYSLPDEEILSPEQLVEYLNVEGAGRSKPCLVDIRPVQEHLRARLRGSICAPYRPSIDYAQKLLAQLPSKNDPSSDPGATPVILIVDSQCNSAQALDELRGEGVRVIGCCEADEAAWRALGLNVLRLEEILPEELAARRGDGVNTSESCIAPVPVDVREPHEWLQGVIPGAVLFPLNELFADPSKLDADVSYVMVCRSGARSRNATYMLQERGFRDVVNLSGGMMAWKQANLPMEPVQRRW